MPCSILFAGPLPAHTPANLCPHTHPQTSVHAPTHPQTSVRSHTRRPLSAHTDERYFQQILFGYLDGARRDECSLDDLLAQANAPKAGCRSYMFCQDVVSGWLQKLEEQNFVMVREDKDDGWTVYLI